MSTTAIHTLTGQSSAMDKIWEKLVTPVSLTHSEEEIAYVYGAHFTFLNSICPLTQDTMYVITTAQMKNNSTSDDDGYFPHESCVLKFLIVLQRSHLLEQSGFNWFRCFVTADVHSVSFLKHWTTLSTIAIDSESFGFFQHYLKIIKPSASGIFINHNLSNLSVLNKKTWYSISFWS